MAKPITPAGAAEYKAKNLPDEVLECWNTIIAQHFNGDSSCFKQEEVVAAIVKKLGCQRKRVFDENWLDVEPLFRAAGWTVKYDRPGYNETYPATFEFTPKRKRSRA